MPCEEMVGGCIAGDRAPFAVHALDEERAFQYLICCRKNDLRWADVKMQIEDYLTRKGVAIEAMAGDLEMA